MYNWLEPSENSPEKKIAVEDGTVHFNNVSSV